MHLFEIKKYTSKMYYLIKTYNLIDYYKFNEKNIPKNKIYFGEDLIKILK